MPMPSAGHDPIPAPVSKRAAGLYTIIAFKTGKGLLLLLVSLGIFSLLGQDLDDRLEQFLKFVNLNPEREFWTALGKQLQSITPTKMRWLASGSLLYAALLGIESLGLSLRAWWAVWLAIGETAFFIPIEVFDLVEHPSWLISSILVLNSLIVAYLVRNRDRLFHHHPPPKP